MQPVTDYISSQTGSAKSAIQRVYDIARKTVPDTAEGVKYAMPCLIYKEKGLISVMVTKQHIAIYPFSGNVPAEVGDRLKAGGFEYLKGTIKFQADHELPEDLIKEIVLIRKAEIDAKV